jgi:hypothetical protein
VARLIGHQRFQCGCQFGGLFGRDVETKRLDGDQSSFGGIVCAKDGSEAAGPHLV